MRKPHRILVVDDDTLVLTGMVELLRGAGHEVTGTYSVEAARRWLAQSRFDLLITEVRIGAHNGLQLMATSRFHDPEMACIVVTRTPDSLVEMAAWRHGAAVAIKPVNEAAFRALVAERLAAIRRQQRWPRKSVTGHVPVRVAGTLGRLVDVSYGGLGFEIPAPDGALPSYIHVDVPAAALSMRADLIWSERLPQGSTWRCGVQIPDRSSVTPAWRAFVDAIPG